MRRAIAGVALLGLWGCAIQGGYGLRSGESSEADIRAAMGPPAVVLPNPDGSRILAYPTGPLGTQTLIAEVGPDGRLHRLRSALNDEGFQRIQPGMTRDDVLRLIGPPGETMAFPRLRHEAWDYRFTDTWGYTAIFSVTFDERGTVVGKLTRRLERGGFMGFGF